MLVMVLIVFAEDFQLLWFAYNELARIIEAISQLQDFYKVLSYKV